MNMLQSIKLIALVGILLFLYGCQGLRSHKWVENNTLYSANRPAIEIHVNQHLHEGKDTSKSIITEDSIGFTTRMNTDDYLFWDEEGKQQLIIQISNLNKVGWFMKSFNFSTNPALLTFGKEEIEEWIFDTGIYVRAMPQQSFLVKIFGKNFGKQTRVILLYLEKIDSSWNAPALVLNSVQKAFLEAFEKRAGESFSIRSFSGINPPEQRAEVIVSKQ